jgi:hypothetical protein
VLQEIRTRYEEKRVEWEAEAEAALWKPFVGYPDR